MEKPLTNDEKIRYNIMMYYANIMSWMNRFIRKEAL